MISEFSVADTADKLHGKSNKSVTSQTNRGQIYAKAGDVLSLLWNPAIICSLQIKLSF